MMLGSSIRWWDFHFHIIKDAGRVKLSQFATSKNGLSVQRTRERAGDCGLQTKRAAKQSFLLRRLSLSVCLFYFTTNTQLLHLAQSSTVQHGTYSTTPWMMTRNYVICIFAYGCNLNVHVYPVVRMLLLRVEEKKFLPHLILMCMFASFFFHRGTHIRKEAHVHSLRRIQSIALGQSFPPISGTLLWGWRKAAGPAGISSDLERIMLIERPAGAAREKGSGTYCSWKLAAHVVLFVWSGKNQLMKRLGGIRAKTCVETLFFIMQTCNSKRGETVHVNIRPPTFSAREPRSEFQMQSDKGLSLTLTALEPGIISLCLGLVLAADTILQECTIGDFAKRSTLRRELPLVRQEVNIHCFLVKWRWGSIPIKSTENRKQLHCILLWCHPVHCAMKNRPLCTVQTNNRFCCCLRASFSPSRNFQFLENRRLDMYHALARWAQAG